MRVYLVLGKNLNLLWSTFYAIGQIFNVANGLILTNNVAIWSHCSSEAAMQFPLNFAKLELRHDCRLIQMTSAKQFYFNFVQTFRPQFLLPKFIKGLCEALKIRAKNGPSRKHQKDPDDDVMRCSILFLS